MSSNIREFDLAVKTWGGTVPPTEVAKLHRAVQVEALRGVVMMTPVREGRARGAWVLGIGVPPTGEPGGLDPSGGGAVARGMEVVTKIPPYSLSWLANSVPYIRELEGGSSKQAPRGMVSVTVARIRAMFR